MLTIAWQKKFQCELLKYFILNYRWHVVILEKELVRLF